MNELHSFIKETFAQHQKFYEIILKQTKIILSKYEKSDFQNKSEESESSDPESLTESTKDRLDQQMEKRIQILKAELTALKTENQNLKIELEQKTGDYTTLSHQIKAISKDKQELHKRASALSSQNKDLQVTNQSLNIYVFNTNGVTAY